MLRDTNSLVILVQFANEIGMPLEMLFKGTAVSDIEGVSQVEEETELKALANLLHWWLLHRPMGASKWQDTQRLSVALGWQLGKRYQLTSYGIWGYALLASGSQREAIQLGLRYLGLTYTFCHIRFDAESPRPFLSLSPVDGLAPDLAALVLMRDLTALTVINRELFQGPAPRVQVSLPSWLVPRGVSPSGSDVSGVKSLLDVEAIEFLANDEGSQVGLGEAMQTDARVYLDPAWLDRALPRANRQTADLCEDQCRKLLEQKRCLSGVCGDVRTQILAQGVSVSMAKVADALGMTERTLHRKLKAEQSSWRQVRDDVRFGMAEELLQTQMSIEAIAGQLGFSDGANFIHGFKRWSGVTPGKYRAQTKSG